LVSIDVVGQELRQSLTVVPAQAGTQYSRASAIDSLGCGVLDARP
jgi:hypothetical protein